MALKYLLDTNILTNPGKPEPDLRVLAMWTEHEAQLATTATCWNEAWFGCLRMPAGKRRKYVEDFLESLSALPILPYTGEAARWLAAQQVRLEKMGLRPQIEDGQIAAVAHVNDLIVITDNVLHFKPFHVAIENWMSRPI